MPTEAEFLTAIKGLLQYYNDVITDTLTNWDTTTTSAKATAISNNTMMASFNTAVASLNMLAMT
jgi:hypothetical protein